MARDEDTLSVAPGPPLVIFGATGFVGGVLRSAAASWPREVIVVSRRACAPRPNERIVSGDLTRPAELASSLPMAAILINLVYDARASEAENLSLADGLADCAAASGAERVIHVSTAMVVGRTREPVVSEATECRPVSSYQRTKLAVEDRLRVRGRLDRRLVVVRPTAVFGRGGLNLRKLVADLSTRPSFENYLRACLYGTRAMNLVPAETVAAAILHLARRSREQLQSLYLVSADEVPENNFRDVERTVRQGLGLGSYALPVVPLPGIALSAMLAVSRRLSVSPRTRFSSERLRAEGFAAPITFRDALIGYAADAALSEPSEVLT